MMLAVAIIYGICMLLIAVNEMGLPQACFLGFLIFGYVIIERLVDANKGRKKKQYREKGITEKEDVI